MIPHSDELKTDDLISRLAAQAGEPEIRPGLLGRVPAHLGLPAALVFAALGALAIVILVIGLRPDLGGILLAWTFQFKVAAMTLAAFGAYMLVRSAMIPGIPIRPLVVMTPAIVLIVFAAIFDRSGFPVFGAHALSVPFCVSAILLASLPALMIILAAMRLGIPTRLSWAGGVAGILAGSLGALAYALACLNDGTAFVALWYSLSIAIMAAVGSIAGRKVLAW